MTFDFKNVHELNRSSIEDLKGKDPIHWNDIDGGGEDELVVSRVCGNI